MSRCRLFSGRLVTPRRLLFNLIYVSVCFSLFLVLRSANDVDPTFNEDSTKDTRFLTNATEPKKNTTVAPVIPAKTHKVVVEKFIKQNKTALHHCPIKSPYLVGDVRENLENVTLPQLEASFSSRETLGRYSLMEVGGHFYPKICTARQKLAVLIPFRNRHQHLPILLNNLIPILNRQLLDFRIYVIEQEPGVTFNKGVLYNTGFITALSREKFDCVVFHDVDCLPLNDNIIYQCESQPRHLLAAGSKWNFSLSYPQLNGGALLMSREQFIAVNGYSNLYFGWGSEDDDIRSRIIKKRYKILRYPKTIGRYFQLKHERDIGNEENEMRFHLVRFKKRQMVEGLRTTVCKIRSIEVKPLFVWIRVSINMTQVLQTAPVDLKRTMKGMMEAGKSFDALGFGHSEVADVLEIPS